MKRADHISIFLLCFLCLIFLFTIVEVRGIVGPDSTYHIFWAKFIEKTHKIPTYLEFSKYELPRYLPGAHIILANLYILGKLNEIKTSHYLSVVFLSLSIFTLYTFANRIYRDRIISMISVVFLTFCVVEGNLQLIYSGSYPNLIGNMLMPIFILFFIEFITTRKPIYFVLSIAIFYSIFETHQLVLMVTTIIAGLLIGIVFLPYRRDIADKFKAQNLFINIVYVIIFILLVILFLKLIPSSWIEFLLSKKQANVKLAPLFPPVIYEKFHIFLVLSIFSFISIKKMEKKEKIGHLAVVLWFIILFILSIIHNLYPIPINPLRFVYMSSYPLSILAAVGATNILKLAKNRYAIFIIIFVVITSTIYMPIEKSFKLKMDGVYLTDMEIDAWRWIKNNSKSDDVIVSDLWNGATTGFGRAISMRMVMFRVSPYTMAVYPDEYLYTLEIPKLVLENPDNVNSSIIREFSIKYVYLLNDRNNYEIRKYTRTEKTNKLYVNKKVSIFTFNFK